MRHFYLLPILAIILLCIPFLSFSQVHISGPQSGVLVDTTYIVDGDIIVQENDSLTILSGAVFKFLPDCEFVIMGYLYAVGTYEDSIYFRPESISFWRTISFDYSAHLSHASEFGYVDICGAQGGGINLNYADISITDCYIHDNLALYGGGIYINHSNPLIINCKISNNTTYEYAGKGGGIYVTQESAPIIENCIIQGNDSGLIGGGICYRDNSVVYVSNCQIIANGAYTGTAVWIEASEVELFDNNIIADNIADQGGAIVNGYNVSLSMTNCQIINNSAQLFFPSAIYAYGMLTLENCLIANNSNNSNNGTIIVEDTTYIINSTIVSNLLSSPSNCIEVDDTYLYMQNGIMSDNSGCGIFASDASIIDINFSDFHNNEIADFGGAISAGLGEITTTNFNGDSCDIYSNIFLDPLFQAVTGDSAFRLTADSPCIDAGDPASPLDPDSTIADIGAYYFHHVSWVEPDDADASPAEFALHPSCPNPFNQSTVISFELRDASFVSLKIFDINGREVVKLVEGMKSAGLHQVLFEGKDLASGVYLVRLGSGDEVYGVKKLVLIK